MTTSKWGHRCWPCKWSAKHGSRGLVGQGSVQCGCGRLAWSATASLTACPSWEWWQRPGPFAREGKEPGAASWLSAHLPSDPSPQPQAQAHTSEGALNSFQNTGKNYLKSIGVDNVITGLFFPSKIKWTCIYYGDDRQRKQYLSGFPCIT